MFERLMSRSRLPSREWLLVRPSTMPEAAWQWLHYSAQQVRQSGTWPPPADCLHLPTALIIPALHCSHFCLPAPPGLKRHEWPQLFEEYVQQPVESLLVSCLSRETGHLELLVMQREKVERWLAECAELGLLITHGWAEMQLLPQPEAGQAVRWQREQMVCLKMGGGAQPRKWLVWPDVLGQILPPAWREVPAEHIEGAWPSRLAPLGHLPSVLDCPRPARSGSLRYPSLTRLQRRLLGGCALLVVSWGGVYLLQTWQQLEVWKAQVATVAGPGRTIEQARGALARLKSREDDWRVRQQQVVMLEQAVSEWLAREPGWSVSNNDFDGRLWTLGLSGPGPLPAQHWQAIALSVGAELRVEPQGAVFDLGEQP